MVTRKFVIVSALLISFIFSTACSCCNNNMVTNEYIDIAKSELTFRITWKDYSGRGEAIQKIVDTYNEDFNDGCAISMVNGNEDLASIESLIESNAQIIYLLPYRFVKYFGDKGVLADLTTEFEDSEKLFYPEVWKLGTANGKTYGIPWLGHSICLLYNKSLLNKAGVEADCINSMESFLDAIKTVEEKTDAKGIGLVGAASNDVSWMVNQFIYGFGSSLVNDDGTKVVINNEKSKEALLFYKNALGKHAQSTWVNDTGNEVMTYFRNQEVAFELQGIWGVTDILKNGAPFEVGVIALNDIGLCAEVGPMMLSIPASMNEEIKSEAIKFIYYAISKEVQEKIMYGEYSPERDAYYPFRTPIRIDMADSQIFQSYPEYLTFIEGFEKPSIDVPVPAWQTIKDDFYEAGLHKVMNGQISIDEFLKMVETQGNEIINAQ